MEDKKVLGPAIFRFKDEPTVPDIIHDYDALRGSNIPLIMDNGSYKCRIGWMTDKEPRITFKNVMAKGRTKKDTDITIGNDITNIEVVRWQLRSQFDRNVVTHFDIQEQIFDYTFSHLGIDTEGCVDHPLVLTEAACNPNLSRQYMSELLFECYHIPSVTYGVDALYSLYNNHSNAASADALVLSCGYQTTHILPVLGGQLQGWACRRMNVGGSHIDAYMQRLLQLKYPGHLAAITLSRAEELVQRHTQVACDYREQLKKWIGEDYYISNVHKFQLPHTQPAAPVVLTAEQQREKRDVQAQRLREINARRRNKRLEEENEKLQLLLEIRMLEHKDEDAFEAAMERYDLEDIDELQLLINNYNNSINKLMNKIQTEQAEDENRKKGIADKDGPGSKKPKEEKKTGLISQVPTGEELKPFLQDVHKQREDLLEARATRRQRRSDMAKRRTFASQQRMRMITELAQGTRKKKEDTFGQNDDDWNIYKAINKDGGDSDSEAEQEKLDELETVLREYDPSFQDPNNPNGEGAFDIEEYYRLHIGIERTRVPEVLFQPSLIGMDRAGLVETINFVLNKFSAEDQNRLAQYVYLTGGCASFPGFAQRLEKELLAIRPFQSAFSVHTSPSPVLEAWSGARRWALSPEFSRCAVTRADYEEKGGEYLKEHPTSNRYSPTPVVVQKRQQSESQQNMETPPDSVQKGALQTEAGVS